jgi:serine protease AprX
MSRLILAVLALCVLHVVHGQSPASSLAGSTPPAAETPAGDGNLRRAAVDSRLEPLIQAGQQEIPVLILLRTQPQKEILASQEGRHAGTLQTMETRYAERVRASRETDPGLGEARENLEREWLAVRKAAFEEVEDLIGPEQESVGNLIRRLGGQVVQRYSAVNMLAAVIPASAVGELAAHPAVGRVALDGTSAVKLAVSGPSLGAPAFWDAGFTGAGESVAILDTGLKQEHPAFAGVPVVNKSFLTNGSRNSCFGDAANSTTDLQGHGTHVAGIVASRGAPGWSSHVGIARGLATLYNFKVGYKKAAGTACNEQGNFQTSDVIAALDWAVQNAPLLKILNFSAGSDVFSDDDDQARLFDFFADTYGLALVVAAGNESKASFLSPRLQPGPLASPGIAYNVLSVAAVNTEGTPERNDDRPTLFSSRGPTTGGRKKPDLAAPGGWSDTLIQGLYQPFKGVYSASYNSTEFAPLSGTSTAAPHIAGAAALLRQAGVREPLAVKALLLNSTDAPGWNPDIGWGYANLSRAFDQRNNVLAGTIAAGQARLLKINTSGPLRATLAWNRSVDAARSSGCLSNLDLGLYSAGTGALLALSASRLDNVEQVSANVPSAAVLRVEHAEAGSCRESEAFGLALSLAGYEWASGPQLQMSCNTPAQVEPGSQFQVTCTLRNTGDLPALDATGGIALGGAANPTVQSFGTVPPGASVSRSWSVTAPGTTGVYDLRATADSVSFGIRYASSTAASFTAAPAATTCTVSVSNLSLEVPAISTSVSVSVTATAGCNWTATSNLVWIGFQGAAQGSGNGAVILQIAANPGTSVRTGTIVIGGNTVTVRQAGQPGSPRQKRILPQLAFGASPTLGNWTTELYFHNLTAGTVQVGVSFYGEDGAPLSVPQWGQTTTLNIPGRGTAAMEISSAGDLLQGSVELDLPEGVTGYGIFRQASAGVNPQEGVVPFSSATSTRSTIVFNETSFVTAVAVANPGSAQVSVMTTARDEAGNTLGVYSFNLGPRQRTAFALRDRPELRPILGRRGSIEFSTALGNVSVLGLRFNGLAFTSILPQEQ